MLGYREQMRELTNEGTFDENAIRAIAEEKAKIQVELAVSRAEMRSRIHAIMTPEQQELLSRPVQTIIVNPLSFVCNFRLKS